MQHGIDREPVIAAYAKSAFGLTHNTALVVADDEPRFGATPDLIGDVEVGDIKTTVHDWPSLDDVPPQYVDQILWQMRVTGRGRGRLVFEPHENGVPMRPFPDDFIIRYDPARVLELEGIALEFLAGDGEPDERSAELDALLTEAAARKAEADAAAARWDAAKTRIEEFIGGTPTRFEGSLANLTRSADSTRRTFQSTRLRADHPDLYDAYTTEQPVKGRLTITIRGEK
jgi:hypothetical protein